MIIKNGAVITPYEKRKCDVRVANGIITEIGNIEANGEEIIDATDLYVCPGLVDIHTHGGGGGDFMDATEESFDKALGFHSKNGTTSLLATSLTAPVDQVEDMICMVREYIKKTDTKCRIMGAHLEGPYISYKNKGAQPESYLRVPSKDSYDFILDNKDVIRTVTLAPELDGAPKMIRDLVENGMVVCGGHDDAEKKFVMPAIDAGLSHCTHLWCAMSTVAMRDGVRDIGLFEVGMLDDRLSVELIADNHHITPDMARLVYKCKGADKMCVVSDCLRAGGMPMDGTLYYLGKTSHQFIVSDGVARLPDNTRYAGSIQPISQMVRNLVNGAEMPLVDAIRTASLTPAKVAKLDDKVGSISIGKYADFCFMDKNLNVVKTIVNGKEV